MLEQFLVARVGVDPVLRECRHLHGDQVGVAGALQGDGEVVARGALARRILGDDLPQERQARVFGPYPDCVTNPLAELDLADAGVTSVIWATGYATDFEWLKVDAFDGNGRPRHQRGVSSEPGVSFLGLPWLSKMHSAFLSGVGDDAAVLADHITARG